MARLAAGRLMHVNVIACGIFGTGLRVVSGHLCNGR
jgi:hypothetical protein